MSSVAVKPKPIKVRKYSQRSPVGSENNQVESKREKLTRHAMESMDVVREELELNTDSENDENDEEEIEVPEIKEPWFEYFKKRFDKIDRESGRTKKKQNKRITEVELKVKVNEGKIKVNEDTLTTVCSDLKKLKMEVRGLKAENDNLKRRLITNEKSAYRDNLVMDGVPESDKETPSDCVAKVSETIMNHIGHQLLDSSIQRCHRLGTKPRPPQGAEREPPRPRGILIKFSSHKEKSLVWGDRHKLIDSQIYLNEQFPREIELKRRELYLIKKLIRQNDKYKKCTISGDRLILNGVAYTTENLNQLPDDINLNELYTKKEGEVIYFFRKRSPLSNHHPSPFEIDGIMYTGVEQYYFAEMARKCHDENVLASVMESSDPADQKDASKGIRKKTTFYKAWEGKRIAVMTEGVRQKFLQNPELAEYLRGTAGHTLAEASANDSFWGLGLGMKDDRRLDSIKWGHNNLGLILERIRLEVS